jgi:predicted HicB family RNase H-like nuclease
MNDHQKKRMAFDIPLELHKKVVAKCEPYGLSMTQWVLQLIVKELESK